MATGGTAIVGSICIGLVWGWLLVVTGSARRSLLGLVSTAIVTLAFAAAALWTGGLSAIGLGVAIVLSATTHEVWRQALRRRASGI